MRTGDFILKNAFGDILSLKTIQAMFPQLEIEQYEPYDV